jgi:hypothetical protein
LRPVRAKSKQESISTNELGVVAYAAYACDSSYTGRPKVEVLQPEDGPSQKCGTLPVVTLQEKDPEFELQDHQEKKQKKQRQELRGHGLLNQGRVLYKGIRVPC